MWNAELRALQLIKYRSIAEDKIAIIEYNHTGNRPVRAVVSKRTVQRLLPAFDACVHGDDSIKILGGAMFSFGVTRDKRDSGPVRNKIRKRKKVPSTKVPSIRRPNAVRKRSVVSVDQLETFFKKFCGTDIKTFEANAKSSILSHQPDGVLLEHNNAPGYLQTGSPVGIYKKDDYALVAALIFNDPPGTSVQVMHDDVAGCDRDAIWNMIIPLRLTQCARMAESQFRPNGAKMNVGEATMWDACWRHRGLGNNTDTERVFLHVVFAPYWMMIPNTVKKEWQGFEHLGMTDIYGWPFFNHIHNGHGMTNGIVKEYNRKENINGDIVAVPLHDDESPLKSWVDRCRNILEAKIKV